MLLTIGLAFMAIATCTYLYGPIPKSVPLPGWLEGDVNLGFRAFPSYRAFLIVLGGVLIAVLWYAFERTNLGAKIRAAVDNRRMAQSVGINVDRLFTLTFAVRSGWPRSAAASRSSCSASTQVLRCSTWCCSCSWSQSVGLGV